MAAQEKLTGRHHRAARGLLLVALIAAFALPAYANQPPGPQMILAEILILPVMMLCTALAGAYALVHAKGKRRKGWKPAVAVLAIFLSGMHEGLGLIVTLVFGALAVVRGARLVTWGLTAAGQGNTTASQQTKLSSPRLILSGSLLVLMAAALTGLSFAFVTWWPSENYAEGNLREIVAFQLAHGQQHKDAQGRPQFAALQPQESGNRPFEGGPYTLFLNLHGQGGRYFGAEFKLGDHGHTFQMWVWPRRMPFFPYNYLITLPSFYADHTGHIRVIRVRHTGQRCPADAPVNSRITASDWKRNE